MATTSRGHKLCVANHSFAICCGRHEQKPSTHTDSCSGAQLFTISLIRSHSHSLSPFFSHSCALFCAFLHSRQTQLFCTRTFIRNCAIARGCHPERSEGSQLFALQMESPLSGNWFWLECWMAYGKKCSVQNKKGGHTGRPSSNREETAAPRRYFFSSAGFSAGGGAGACAGGAGVCEVPDMPSLKLRMPSPNPFIISGIRLPPKKMSMTARTTSQ